MTRYHTAKLPEAARSMRRRQAVRIVSLATANPSRYATSREVYDFLVAHFPLSQDELALYRRILLEGPIHGRHVGLDRDEEAADQSPDALLARFQKFGTLIATQAAQRAMEQAGIGPDEIDGIVVNTCTGYLCPGLSSYVGEQLNLPATVRPFDLMGMGCGAAIPNLQTAAGLLASGACNTVLSIAVEVCSATMFMGPDPDLIVSNSIFGDGAAAAIVTADGEGREGGSGGVARVLDFESVLLPKYREELRYRSEGGRLRNTLSKRVPIVAGRAIVDVVDRLLARNDMTRTDVRHWMVHPGGTAVLEQVAERLGLTQADLRCSYEVLRDYGNMSSPSVLFALRRLVEQSPPPAGQRGLLLAFGAGFTAHAALVEF